MTNESSSRTVPLPRGALRVGALIVAATAIVSAACSSCGTTPPERVNVLLVSVDTLRADRLNCYGYARRRTSPAIDAFARDGILFEAHITASPWTIPSHHSLLTSLLPSHHGVTAGLAEFLWAQSGKGDFPRLAREHVTLAEALRDAGRDTAAFTGGSTLDPRLGFDQGFGSYDTSMIKMNPRRMQSVKDWIDDHRERPFFLFWHTFEVHAPYLAGDFLHEALPPETTAALRYKLGRISRRVTAMGMQDGVGAVARALSKHNAFNVDVCNALYDGGVLSIDRFFASLTSHLRERGLYDKTLLILTSDHGEELGEREGGFYDRHGLTVYEEMVRVPLIIKLPGQRYAGTRIASHTSSLDVMPTALDIVRVKSAPPEMEGQSLRPMWERRAANPERLVISEALWKGPEQKAIRSSHEKLILTIDESVVAKIGRCSLPSQVSYRTFHDLKRDPREMTDFLAEAQATESVRQRAALLEQILRKELGRRTSRVDKTDLDEETLKRLRALGYLQ